MHINDSNTLVLVSLPSKISNISQEDPLATPPYPLSFSQVLSAPVLLTQPASLPLCGSLGWDVSRGRPSSPAQVFQQAFPVLSRPFVGQYQNATLPTQSARKQVSVQTVLSLKGLPVCLPGPRRVQSAAKTVFAPPFTFAAIYAINLDTSTIYHLKMALHSYVAT